MNVICILLLTVFSFPSFALNANPLAINEKHLNYKLNLKSLQKGNFQYFFSLLRPHNERFEILNKGKVKTDAVSILKTFLPLDTKNLWDKKEENYLAVAKMNYILPTSIQKINSKNLNQVKYLQKTMPKYKVTREKGYYHVAGSFITPNFDLYLNFLDEDHPFLTIAKEIDQEKVKKGKMKVSYQYQDNFGRVMMFRTAKMASAVSIYEEIDKSYTLVTQYILSYIINVPTQSLVKNSMIENLQDVVKGSREAVMSF